MCSINLWSLIQNRTYPEAGSALYEILADKVETEEKIVLDMNQVAALPSMFLNMSIGKFIDTYGINLLRQKISFANISATQANRIKEYIDRISSK